jgi:hypothetical protein
MYGSLVGYVSFAGYVSLIAGPNVTVHKEQLQLLLMHRKIGLRSTKYLKCNDCHGTG